MDGPHFKPSSGPSSGLAEVCELVLQVCHESQPDTWAIARLVAQAPALAERVIRSSNAIGLGLRRQVTRLDQAITVLGTQRVANIVTQFAAQHRGVPAVLNSNKKLPRITHELRSHAPSARLERL